MPIWNSLRPEVDSHRIVIMPALEYFMNANDVPKYPYILHWSDIRDERVLTVHTSGSTGMSFDRLEIRT
jgi:hypothetical protein